MNKYFRKIFLVLSALALFPGSQLLAQAPAHSLGFEAMKKLEGSWYGSTYKHKDERVWGESSALVTYSITGWGSAVVETLFPGTELEMTTVYHDDSQGNLVMTHYCTAGNQPKLELVSYVDNELEFRLAADADIDAEHEHHAHELTITIGEDGSLQHDWTNHNMGQPADLRNIKLVRLEE